MKAIEQGNEWLQFWNESQKSLFQAWAEGKPPPFAGAGFASRAPEGDPTHASDPISDLMTRSMQEWSNIAQEAWSKGAGFDPEAMRKLFDPAQWKRAGSYFDLGLEKLTEGPTYATLWDLDRKTLNVQKLWLERARDAESYWEVVQSAWSKALDRFTKAVNDPKGPPIPSGRAMLDLWLEVANGALVEMHRSDKFLEAQRRMTRSSTEYRLAEREIAEAFCEMHHIPTRTEMDEVQRTVTELRRELRAVKRLGEAPVAAPHRGSDAKPMPKPKPKPKAKRRK